MARSRQLVLEHLEDVAWRVLDEYPEIIREMIRKRAGVYSLYRKDKLYYVGLASNLMGRIKAHLRDRHRGLWDRFSVYLTVRDDHIKELESLVLRIVDPAGNKVKGKFSRAVSLRRRLNQEMTDHDADRRALFLGGQMMKRRRKAKSKKTTGSRIFRRLMERRIRLRGTRRGRVFKASLLKNGSISFRRKLYDSPSAAARVAVGQNCNGWRFWKYSKSGEWVSLRNLRK